MANRLFGVTFEEVAVEGWNPVVVSFDVKDADGEHLGLFMTDMYARDSKRGGAWMSTYRGTSNINGNNIRPLITNNLNLPTPPEGEPTLMRFSDVETLFHEFGHGLHGLMTQIDYPMFSGVDGPRDYTEFPAQILEHWTSQPEMLELYARHYETDEVIPTDLVERMLAAGNHNQGFATTEYIAASLLDLRWHMLSTEEAAANNRRARVREGSSRRIRTDPRDRASLPVELFRAYLLEFNGLLVRLLRVSLVGDSRRGWLRGVQAGRRYLRPGTAARLKKWVYEAGGLRDADELYRNFRGQDPSIEPLLEGRGFAVEETGGN